MHQPKRRTPIKPPLRNGGGSFDRGRHKYAMAVWGVESMIMRDNEMHDEKIDTLPEPIPVLVKNIEARANKSVDHIIAAAMLVQELRRRVEAGEAGDVKWYAWARQNINLGLSRLRELQRIAEAEDPKKELRRLRDLGLERAQKFRAKEILQCDLESERTAVIQWAREAHIDDVRRIHRVIHGRFNVVNSGSIPHLVLPAHVQ